MAKNEKKTQSKKNKNEKPSFWIRLRTWFKGIVSELKKVTWPEKNKQRKNVVAVLAVLVFAIVVIFVFDSVIGMVLETTGFYDIKEASSAPMTAIEESADESEEAEENADAEDSSEEPADEAETVEEATEEETVSEEENSSEETEETEKE